MLWGHLLDLTEQGCQTPKIEYSWPCGDPKDLSVTSNNQGNMVNERAVPPLPKQETISIHRLGLEPHLTKDIYIYNIIYI